MSGRSVAVIGGGPSGLAAAWRLRLEGLPVKVYEARRSAGGRLRTEEVSGAAADGAVQFLSDGYSRTLEMVRDLGLEGRLRAAAGRDALWRSGRAHGLRYGSMASMLASGALPTGLKLKMGARYLPFLERHAAALDLNEPALAAGAGLDRESIAEWGRRELGDAFVELLAYPLLAAYYGVTPEETSAAFFHCLARAGMRVSVLGVAGGMGRLGESIAAALRARDVAVRLGQPIQSVVAGPNGVSVRGPDGVGDHAAAVLAVPAAEAAALAPDLPFLDSIRSRPTATLVLVTEGRTDTGWFGLSIPRAELPGSTLAAVCVQEEKDAGLTPTGRGALVLMPTPEEGERWSAAEPADALESALPWLEAVLPGARERVAEARLIRLPGAVVPYPGYFERLRAFDPDRGPARLALAGDQLVAPTVEGAVRAGVRAAERVIRAGW